MNAPVVLVPTGSLVQHTQQYIIERHSLCTMFQVLLLLLLQLLAVDFAILLDMFIDRQERASSNNVNILVFVDH